MAQMSKWISNLRFTRLMAAQIARTAGAIAAGVDGLPVILKCDETGAMLINVASGGSIPITPASVAFASSNSSVGAASAQIVAASATRKFLMIQNTHATQYLYLSLNNPATVSDIILAPGGASLSFGNLGPTNAVYGIGSGAATTFAILSA